MLSSGNPITLLINDFVGSSGNQNTMMSPRFIEVKVYSNLFTNMRSSFSRRGCIDVPSTLTGCTTNTTIRTAITAAKMISRVIDFTSAQSPADADGSSGYVISMSGSSSGIIPG